MMPALIRQPLPMPSLVEQDPRGRLDVMAFRLVEAGIRGFVEPRIGLRVWDRGIGTVVEQMIRESDIPSVPLTALEVARLLGLVRGGR